MRGILLILLALLVCVLVSEANAEAVPATDGKVVYVLPNGAGSKDGSSWSNAVDASNGGLQKAIDGVAAGGTVLIGSGTYLRVELKIARGDKKLIGKDIGGGFPVFTGTFDKQVPTKGETFLELKRGVRDLWVQDILLSDYQFGINARGEHENLRFVNVDATGCRECISLDGGVTSQHPNASSQNIQIEACDLVNYTKRGLRIFNGNSNVNVINTTADGGGKEWATEFFQMGFQVSKKNTETEKFAPDHDITFTNCVARNNFNDAGKEYWNADGFVAETGSYNLRFVNCMAFDNTDGGWDDKSTSTTYEGCIAFRNKRNFRFWGEVRMYRTIGGYSVFPGGSGDDLGVWASGKVIVESSTFHNNGTGIKIVENGSVELRNSIVSGGKGNKLVVRDGDASKFSNIDSLLWNEGDAVLGPAFVKPTKAWNGVGNNFDSRTFGNRKGYFSTNRIFIP